MASLVKPTKHLRASLVAHPKGDQSWVFIGRTDDEAETLILWPPHAKSWLIGKDPHGGQDWRQEEKGTTGWDGWMASPTQWTWVWVNSRSWWWTGRPGLLRSMGSQRVGHDWATFTFTKHLKDNQCQSFSNSPTVCRGVSYPNSFYVASITLMLLSQSCLVLCDPMDL